MPPPRQRSAHPKPLPESNFISSAQRGSVSLGGSVAGQAERMKLEKLRAYEAKKEAALTETPNKTAEAKQLKSQLIQQRNIEAQQRKEAAAELKKQVAAEKKAAQLEAKAKKAADKRNLEAQKRAATTGTSQPDKVSLFDELRG